MKTGEMAFVIKCPPQPLNIGVVVTLRKFHRTHLAWLCEGNVKPSPGAKPLPDEVPYQLTWVPSEWLRPIRGDGVDDEEVRELYDPRELVLVTRERA